MTEKYHLEKQIGHLLRRATQRHTSIFAQEFDHTQLTPTQFAALVTIDEAKEVSQNHLGRMTAMDPATIQGVVRRLEKRGLVKPGPDPNDGRRSLWRLSPQGRELLEQSLPIAVEVTRPRHAPAEAIIALAPRLGGAQVERGPTRASRKHPRAVARAQRATEVGRIAEKQVGATIARQSLARRHRWKGEGCKAAMAPNS